MAENGGPTMEQLLATIATMRQENEDDREEDRKAKIALQLKNAKVKGRR